jgi:pyruvate-ferredoxin/flavodoxin oxidoreductase
VWESKDLKFPFQEFLKRERRYTSLTTTAPDEADKLFGMAEKDATRRFECFRKMGDIL